MEGTLLTSFLKGRRDVARRCRSPLRRREEKRREERAGGCRKCTAHFGKRIGRGGRRSSSRSAQRGKGLAGEDRPVSSRIKEEAGKGKLNGTLPATGKSSGKKDEIPSLNPQKKKGPSPGRKKEWGKKNRHDYPIESL